MQTKTRHRPTGLACGITCFILPFAILPSTDSEFATVASWYGPGFQGRKTASGATFDTNKMTAASRTLPFGTKVLVKNPKNGKTCEVIINDRGPYVRGRDIDLSHAAAQNLGISGIAPVICYTGAARGTAGTANEARDAGADSVDEGSSPPVNTPLDAAGGQEEMASAEEPKPAPSPAHFHHGAMPGHYQRHQAQQPQVIASRPSHKVHRSIDRSQQYIAYHSVSRPRYTSYRSQQRLPKPAPQFSRSIAHAPRQQYIASTQASSFKFKKAVGHFSKSVAHLYKAVKYGVLASL